MKWLGKYLKLNYFNGIKNKGLVLVSSRNDELFKVRTLEMGADDLFVKPFSKWRANSKN